MRITPQIIVSTAIYNEQQQTAQLATLQQQASTGYRINQPSDDPVGEMEVLSGQDQYNQLTTYQKNITDAQSKLNSSVSTLTQVSDLLTQAKDLGLEGSNSTNTASGYQAMAAQVNSILNEVVQLANTQQNGQYLYGGTASSTTAPFSYNAQGQLAYNGSTQALNEPIGQGQQVQTLYAGNQIFQSPDVFQLLSSLSSDLSNVSNLSPAAQVSAIQQTLQGLDNANTNILNITGQQSASLQNLQGVSQQIQNVQLQTKTQIGNVQNADISQVVINLQEQQNLLQATLDSTARVLSTSLLDFLH